MPRYSYNYSLFYQLLDSNLFTHRNTYAILREATSETYGPRVYFISYKFLIYNSSLLFILFCNLYFSIYTTKIPKIFILLSLLDLTFVSDPEGIDNPFIALVARFLFVCAGTRWLACSLLLIEHINDLHCCYVLSLHWFSLKRKEWCSNSSVSISLSFWEPRYQSSRRLKSPTHLHKPTKNSQTTQ